MFKNNKGITLIALVITIIILLILAGVSVSVLFGQEGLVEKAKWSAFASDLTKIEESIILSNKIGENGTTLPEEEVFVGLYDGTKISNTLKRDIVYAKEGKESEYTQEEINTKYEALKDDEGKIENLYYVSKKVSGKEKKYLYDKSSGTVFDAPGRTIFGKKYHIYKIGSITKTANGANNINKPKGPVLPEPSDEIPDGWIPIYTIENWQKVATETQNYDIYNLSGVKVGTYNMNKNSNYRLMSDLDFTGVTVDPIKGFAGIFDGNGHYIRNITVDTSASTEKYSYYSEDNLKTSGIDEIEVIAPAGLFDRIELGTVKNLGIQSATITGKGNVGILAGEVVETTIENSIVKDSTATSDGHSNEGSIGGLIGWAYKKENPTTIKDIKMDNVNVTGASVTSGIIGTTTADIVITGSLVENSTIFAKPDTKWTSYEAQGGILGFTAGTTVTIDNCYVGKSTLKNNLQEINSPTSGIACGGIFGATYYQGTNTVTVSNSSVEDTELALGAVNGGICGSLSSSNVNINIYKCNTKGLKTNALTVGGILGYAGYSITSLAVTECNVDNLQIDQNIKCTGSGNSNFAGIVAFTNFKDSCEIKKCNVTNSTISVYDEKDAKGGIVVAGILGGSMKNGSTATSKIIKDCNVENTTLKIKIKGNSTDTSTENAYASGIAGYTSLNIENCKVDNSHILLEAENAYEGSYDSYGDMSKKTATSGILGTTNNGEGSTISECKVLNTEINTNYGYALGIYLHNGSSNMNTKNCRVEKCKILGKLNTAGVTNFCSSSDNVNMSNVIIKETDIISEIRGAAGIANLSWNGTTISDCIVQDCKIENTKQEASKGVSTYGTGTRVCGNVGGIVGYCQSSKITNCNVIDTKITNNYMNTGGIAGFVVSGPENITGCTVTNTNITAKDQNVGGIAGYFGSGSSSVKNNTVIGGSITAKGPFVGGIVGYDGNSNGIEGATAKDITINVTEGLVGGISGAYSQKLTKCNVENVNLTSNGKFVGGLAGYACKSDFSDCNVKSSKIITQNSAVGGIVGNAPSGTINVCNVTDTEIEGKDNGVGGIIGEVSGRLNIKGDGNQNVTSSNVTNCKIKITGADAKAVGGIIGNGYNIKEATGTIDSCIVSGTEITGIDYVGGISGVATPNITNCTVEKNTTITGTNCVGGIQGFGGIHGMLPISYVEYTYTGTSSTKTSKSYYDSTQKKLITNTSDEVSTMSNIDGCTVKNSSIKGTTDVNYIQGKNSYFKDDWTGIKSEDTITNSTYESVTLN